VWYWSNEVEDEEDVEEDDKEVEDDEDGDEENGEDIAEDGDDRDEEDDDDSETSAVGLRWTCICARTPSYLYSNNKFAPLAHANTS
jgi:hypothetical protein